MPMHEASGLKKVFLKRISLWHDIFKQHCLLPVHETLRAEKNHLFIIIIIIIISEYLHRIYTSIYKIAITVCPVQKYIKVKI